MRQVKLPVRDRSDRPTRPLPEWNRLVDGKLRQRIVSPEQAHDIKRALDNHQRILNLLAQWQQESITLILRPES